MKTLIEFRKESALTSTQMSEILGVTLSYYCKIEKGTRNPSYNFLKKFKKAFPNVDIDKIFFGNNLDKTSKKSI